MFLLGSLFSANFGFLKGKIELANAVSLHFENCKKAVVEKDKDSNMTKDAFTNVKVLKIQYVLVFWNLEFLNEFRLLYLDFIDFPLL